MRVAIWVGRWDTAIRQFVNEIPGVYLLIFNDRFGRVLVDTLGQDYKLVKSIYFDKPAASNWFVSYHQDLTIAVKERIDCPGFAAWTIKEDQFSVQPPIEILEDNITVRIHLDDTTVENGALKVIPGSHLEGIYRPEKKDTFFFNHEVTCSVPLGGIMLMKPLLLHSSGRTTNNEQRRVIHLEFSRAKLPGGLAWAEFIEEPSLNS